MQFHQDQYWTSLYWNDSGVGYLLPRDVSAPKTIELADSWKTYGGCYLLVGAPVANTSFEAAVRAFLDAPGMAGTRFAWFADPNQTSHPLTGPTLTFAGPPDASGTATLRSTATFSFGGVVLVITAGATATLAADGFTLAPAKDSAYLIAPDDVQLDVVSGTSSIDLSSSTPATITVPLQLGTTDGVDDLTHLDAGLRMFFPIQDSQGDDPVFIGSHCYPLFAPGEIAMEARLDPNAPLDPMHTMLRFTGTTAIPSRFVTNTGHPYSLTPGNAAFFFTPRPDDTSGQPATSYYLAPFGMFTLDRPGSNLMCGISGVEYLKLPAAGPSTITFIPGHPAYASGDQAAPLSAVATTSWALVTRIGDPMTYCAQPDSATLYQLSHDAENRYATLDYLEVPAATLRDTDTPVIPLLPYNGIATVDADRCRAIEVKAVAPARRKIINDLGPAAPSGDHAPPGGGGDVIVGATPQGLLASFAPDFTAMTRVTLALNADGTEVAFHDIPAGTVLWSALQCNQLFLVISDPASIRPFLTPPSSPGNLVTQLRADGWTFDVNPAEGGGWRPIDGDQPTFLVLKFAAASFRDLAAAPGSWAQAADFNAGNPLAAAAKLQAFIEDTIASAAHDPNLAWFAGTVLQDPDWNGVVAINCHTPIDGWPEQLQGLAAGVDPKKLVAHHAGVQVTPIVTTEAGTLALQPSSIFGLIDYRDTTPIPASTIPYDFKVAVLEVLLANSHVAGFAGQVLLQVNVLFGEPATCAGATDNNLPFNGTYQSTNGRGSYAFLLAGPNVLKMKSAVLDEITLTRAEFITAAEPRPDGTTKTRFQLWGKLRFHALAGFDAFSFDVLPFAGPGIDMVVTPTGTPGLPPAKVMTFDAGHVSLDVEQSTARTTSLYAAFPLKLTGFVEAGANTTPTDLGYAPVSTPIPATQLGAPWYGLELQLELGGQGAWAPAGNLSAGLLLAWSATGSERADVFAGLQLPGTAGGQLQMTLEGPLKLSLKNLAFQVEDGAYLLWMQSLALGFFGLTFPPGRTDILLFAKGDGSKTLGWYAVYDKGSSVQQAGGNQRPVRA